MESFRSVHISYKVSGETLGIVWKKPEHEWTTSTRQYNRHELCNPFVHLNAMRDHGDPSTWDLCLTSMFPYMLPTDDMLSSIHKHFSSLEVERTCWVADWQKNIVIGWLVGRHSWDKKLRFHELCNPLECDGRSWRSVNVRSMPIYVSLYVANGWYVEQHP